MGGSIAQSLVSFLVPQSLDNFSQSRCPQPKVADLEKTQAPRPLEWGGMGADSPLRGTGPQGDVFPTSFSWLRCSTADSALWRTRRKWLSE